MLGLFLAQNEVFRFGQLRPPFGRGLHDFEAAFPSDGGAGSAAGFPEGGARAGRDGGSGDGE